jgi:DNA repair protein RecN (Recombination protein N)
MLTTLRIKNLALVDDLTLELQPGYNVITGETGAGKSILIGALNLVLGERADRTLIRGGCDSCSVEAVFDVSQLLGSRPTGSDAPKIVPRPATKDRGAISPKHSRFEPLNLTAPLPSLSSPSAGEERVAAGRESSGLGSVHREGRPVLALFLEQNGLEPCEEDQLVLKRTFTAGGANRQFVNGSPTTLNVLAALGERLVDIHGPHDHQSLLQPARQLAILDAYGDLERGREAFGELVRRRTTIASERAALMVDEKTYAQQLDLLRFQVKEIESARLQPGEDQEVEAQFHRASNAAKLLQLSQTALHILSENENALLTQAGVVGRTLQELQRVDPGAARLVELHAQSVSALRELQAEISRYAEKADVDPEQLAGLEERWNLLHSLKRKYGASLAEVVAFGDEASRKLQALESRDAEITRLNDELAKLDAELARQGKDLSGKRRKIIPQLARAVSRLLADLGFKQSRFDIEIKTETWLTQRTQSPQRGVDCSENPLRPSRSLRETGLDDVDFQFAPNPGEPARPLRAIASSGEMARVMLALKTVLAAEDEIPVLIFDEVDANVGGETAIAVGEKMRQIALRRQVLCITHLPQVAAPAFAHYVVTKQMKEGRTISEIALLDQKQRVTELTRMLGGQSEAARKHAEALLTAQ